MTPEEKFDFKEKLMKAFDDSIEHLFKCPICSTRLSELLKDAQTHDPTIISDNLPKKHTEI